MAKRNIGTFDLNLLLVFDAMSRERSVTAAGRAVGLSQPSMSNALRRLRHACGDPLFVRTRDGMQPTPEAQRLAEPVRQALTILRASFLEELAFDPAGSQRVLRILLSDVGEIAVLPRLARVVAENAPAVAIESVSRPRERYVGALENGEADLAIARSIPAAPGLRRRHLFNDRYVCLVRDGHPRIRERIDAAQFRAETHIGVGAPGSDGDVLGRLVSRHGLELHVGLRVHHFVVASLIAANSDMVVTVPNEIVEELRAVQKLRVLPLPLSLPGFSVSLYWHPRYHQDQSHRWLRSKVLQACRFESA